MASSNEQGVIINFLISTNDDVKQLKMSKSLMYHLKNK